MTEVGFEAIRECWGEEGLEEWVRVHGVHGPCHEELALDKTIAAIGIPGSNTETNARVAWGAVEEEHLQMKGDANE